MPPPPEFCGRDLRLLREVGRVDVGVGEVGAHVGGGGPVAGAELGRARLEHRRQGPAEGVDDAGRGGRHGACGQRQRRGRVRQDQHAARAGRVEGRDRVGRRQRGTGGAVRGHLHEVVATGSDRAREVRRGEGAGAGRGAVLERPARQRHGGGGRVVQLDELVRVRGVRAAALGVHLRDDDAGVAGSRGGGGGGDERAEQDGETGHQGDRPRGGVSGSG